MEMKQLTKIAMCWELFEENVPKGHIAERIGVHRETVREWIVGIAQHPQGLSGFLEQYINAKKGERTKRKVDGLLRAKIYRLREDNNDCCGQKIAYYLKQQYGVSLGVKAIYAILAEKYKLRSKWKKNQHRGELIKATKPREVIQMDTVHFGMIFAFTSIDTYSKDVSVALYPTLTSSDGKDFLVNAFENRFHHTELLQTDGGPEFKGEFKQTVFNFADRFRVARPYKKNEQSYIESFNRSLRKECLGWGNFHPKDISHLKHELTDYLTYYHTKRAHLSLNMQTPNDILQQFNLMTDF
jgi:transposase